MDVSILYLQTNDKVAATLKDNLDLKDIEFLVVKSAAEALEMLSQRSFLLILVDSYIPDMKQMDFVRMISKEYPDLVINVCTDVGDPKHVPAISGIRRVTKIYLPPWEIDEILDGVASSIDAACLEQDLNRRRDELAADMVQFESTLASLKDALIKQRFSYYKLRNVLNPYMDALVKVSNAATLSEEDLHAKTNDASSVRGMRNEYCAFVKAACEKMLRVMTTAKLETEKLDDIMRSDFSAGFQDFPSISLEDAANCLMGDIPRDVVAQICFCMWLVCRYQTKRISEGSISIFSRYLTSVSCEYSISVKGAVIDCPPSYRRYVENIILSFAKEFVIEEGEHSTYKIVFEI